MIPSPPKLASRGKRFAGFLADVAVLTAVGIVLVPLTGTSMSDLETPDPTSAFALAYLVVLAIYEIGFIAIRGQTPGKMIVGTKVVDVETREVPDLTGAVGRFAVPAAAGFVPGVGSLLTFVVYGWILWDPRRQGLHDKVATTVVIDLRAQGSGSDG